MGQVTEICFIETENNSFRVEMWQGTGSKPLNEYNRPCKLLRKDNSDEWHVVEKWSGKYSVNQRPNKTENQVITEAIKKMRFYDQSELETVTMNKLDIEFTETNPYFLQPSIQTRNTKYELYRLGASQITEKISTIHNIVEKAKEKAREPAEIIVFEDGKVRSRTVTGE